MNIESTGRHHPSGEFEIGLAEKFGAYASFITPNDPVETDFHGDPPAEEFDRLLDLLVQTSSNVMDLGCGAGFTMCRLASATKSIFGIDLEPNLLQAAKLRCGDLVNVT